MQSWHEESVPLSHLRAQGRTEANTSSFLDSLMDVMRALSRSKALQSLYWSTPWSHRCMGKRNTVLTLISNVVLGVYLLNTGVRSAQPSNTPTVVAPAWASASISSTNHHATSAIAGWIRKPSIPRPMHFKEKKPHNWAFFPAFLLGAISRYLQSGKFWTALQCWVLWGRWFCLMLFELLALKTWALEAAI